MSYSTCDLHTVEISLICSGHWIFSKLFLNAMKEKNHNRLVCRFSTLKNILFIYFFNFFYLFIFRERGREGEREGEKHQCVVASHLPLTEDLAHNPGMCPNWESNQRPFGSQAGAQSTKPHQPGLFIYF